jgi:Zn-dependent protease
MVFFTFGWIRPIAVDPGSLRSGRVGLVAVVAGGSGATLLLAVLARMARPFLLGLLPDTAAATLFIFIETLGQLCISFTLFNLLPLPPLTGQHLLVAALPAWREAVAQMRIYPAVVLMLLVASGLAERLLAPAESIVARVVFGQ